MRPSECKRLAWCALYALETHAVVFSELATTAHVQRSSTPPAVAKLAELLVETAEDATASSEPVQDVITEPVPVSIPRRHHRSPKAPGLPPAAAASAITASAAPASSAPPPWSLAVGSAPNYAGGLTSPQGTSTTYVAQIGAGGDGDGGIFDLSQPARLGGMKNWDCVVNGAPPMTFIRIRALVRPDGSAERLQLLEGGSYSRVVVRGAWPCALREHYIPGRDSRGRVAKRWTRPFRVVVLGQR